MSLKKYEVVISGMGGLFPGCEDMNDVEKKLYNMEEMVEEQHLWDSDVEVPKFIGKLRYSHAVDSKFFGIYSELYNIMDPLTTQCLQYSFEAICDAGINPFSLNGSKTAVLMSSAVSETEFNVIVAYKSQNIGLVGQSRGMQANRVSYFLNLYGPSFLVQDTWTGGMLALQEAYRLISSGECPAVIVGAANTVFGPEMSFHYQAMGRLNNDGKTKSFSADADGYTRSEGCIVFFLQRAEDAKRSYGTIVNVLTTNYGARSTSFPDFCPELYKDLLLRIYKEAHIDPSEVCYIEADGSASKKVDALELNSVSEVMCANRKEPLPVGSVKSNVGHTEAASSFVSLVKVLIALKFGKIPPNLHYTAPNPDVPALLTGQLKVVTQPTPLNGNVVGVSTIGMSGSFGHVIIKQNRKNTNNEKQSSLNYVPRLFLISGRNENLLKDVIEKIEVMPFNEGFFSLISGIFNSHTRGHFFRAFTLKNTVDKQEAEIKKYDGEKKPIWFLFSGMGSQWPGMGVDLMQLPIFARAINHCHEVLLPKGINLLEIIHSTDPHIYDSILNSFVGIAAVQIGLLDVMKELGLEPDGIIGHSVGELGCAYADGCFTAEQTILAAYSRGKASVDVPLIKGMMAAVGLGYNQIKDHLPPTIDVACHNSNISCTLSGPAEDMEQYVNGLKEKELFAKLVNVANIAYHSRYIKSAAPVLLKYLQEVIPEPKLRTKRWISSSVPESSWDNDVAKSSSAEYHTNNLLNPVLFEEACAHIPANAIVIEIAPRGLLQAIVKKSLSKCINIPLVNRFEKDTLTYLFKAIGKIYLEGVNIDINNLYPKIEYPVSGPIPPVSPILTWDKVTSLGMDVFAKKIKTSQSVAQIKIDRSLEKYYGHTIRGKQIIPLTYLLNTAIDKFKKLKETSTNRNSIVIENLFFNQQLEVLENLNKEVFLQVQKESGKYNIVLNSRSIVCGQINYLESDYDFCQNLRENIIGRNLEEMNHSDIYEYLEEYSVNIRNNFKLIQKIYYNETDIQASVFWRGDLATFLDALLMIVSLFETMKSNSFQIVHFVRQICINFSYFNSINDKEIDVFYNRLTQELYCEGLKLHLPFTRYCNIKPAPLKLIKNTCNFLPYFTPHNGEHRGHIDDCLQVIFQNIFQHEGDPKKLTAVLFDGGEDIYNNLLTFREEVEIISSPIEDRLDELCQNLKREDNLLLVGDLPFSKTALSCLEKVTAGFVLVKDKPSSYRLDNLYPVYQFKFNNAELTLHKACHEGKLATNTIVKIDNNKWENDLRLSLKNVKNENLKNNFSKIVYLVGKIKSLFDIKELLQYCQSLENSYFIRLDDPPLPNPSRKWYTTHPLASKFIFVDNKSPPFSFDQPFYKKQLAMDLVMNICINNTWGCLKLSTPNIKSNRVSLQESVYSISSISCENVTLTALGLNLKELPVNSEGGKLDIFDYCGLDKVNNVICGTGSLSDRKVLIEDEILRWQKPQDWTDEDAVSIPYCYSIAYYILRRSNEDIFINRNTILVHRGGLIVSQAIIHLALSKGFEVFTTYTTVEEKKLIHQLFPQIYYSNIYLYKDASFEERLLIRTKSKGVNIVVVTCDDHAMVTSAMLCLSKHGCCFLLNTSVANNDKAIGMYRFLKELSVVGVPTDILLDLPSCTKELIQQDITNGIKEGHVKPLRTVTLSPDILNIDAIAMLNSKSSYKLVATMDYGKNQRVKDLFICSGQSKQIIISSNESGFWLDVVNWLLCRGAMNVDVVLVGVKNLSRSKSLRLMSILNKYPAAYVSLVLKEFFSEGLEPLFEKINSQEISDVFCLGKMPHEEIIYLDNKFKEVDSNIRLICIGSGGETVCELRSKENIPAFAISCDLQIIKAHVILPELDRIVCNSRDDCVIILREDVSSKKAESSTHVNHLERLPEDITELVALQKKLVPKACFVEIVTKCAPLKYNREVDPIFVIPSLKPNEMNNLTSRLFYSTFEARLPHEVDGIDSIAKDLFEDMKRFSFNVFTIIANDWGGAVAFNLAKYLEKDGKLVLLILLNSSPDSVQNWASAVLQLGDDNLIKKYIKLPFKLRQKMSRIPHWDEKLDFALLSTVEKEEERSEIRKVLNILRRYLSSTVKYNAFKEVFHGKCIVYRNKDSAQDDNFKQFCKHSPIINTIDSHNNREMLDDPEFAKIINELIPFEYKTAAHGLKSDSLAEKFNKIIQTVSVPLNLPQI